VDPPHERLIRDDARWIRRISKSSLVLMMVLTSCGSPPNQPQHQLSKFRVQVLATIPHDRTAFTEGFEIHDGVLYESTGLVGQSTLRIADPATGAVQRQVALAPSVFGEGLTVVGDRIWQLTWKDKIAFLWNRNELTQANQVRYTGQGWGLCYDQTRNRLVMSDGSDRLTFRAPDTFSKIGSVRVRMAGRSLSMINELECVDGVIWANVWPSSKIVRIDPNVGEVTAVVDAGGLLTSDESNDAQELNGIAAVPETNTFLLTGKRWPKTFRVRFVLA
jgi:glutaminyl-peptide cyclotransferase